MKKIIFTAIFIAFSSLCVHADSTFTPEKKYSSKEYNHPIFFNWYTMFQGYDIQPGDHFPSANVYRTDLKKIVNSKSLFGHKPVVIEFGSISCAAFIGTKASMFKLYKKYRDQVDFYTLYVRENHPTDKFPRHTNMEAKINHALEYEKWQNSPYPTLVDSVDGRLHQLFDNLPNSILVMDAEGYIRNQIEYADPQLLETRLNQLLADKKLPAKTFLKEAGAKNFLQTKAYKENTLLVQQKTGLEDSEARGLRHKLRMKIENMKLIKHSPKYRHVSGVAMIQLEKKLEDAHNHKGIKQK